MANHIDTTINMLKSRNRNASIINTDIEKTNTPSNFVQFKEI